MRVEILSPALALKSACGDKMCHFIILQRMCGLKGYALKFLVKNNFIQTV